MRLKRGRGRSSTGKYLIFKEIMENMGDLEKECLLVGGAAEKENDIVSSVGRVTPSQTLSHVKHNVYLASLQRFHLTIDMPSRKAIRI